MSNCCLTLPENKTRVKIFPLGQEELITLKGKQSDNQALCGAKLKTLSMSFLLVMYNNVRQQMDESDDLSHSSPESP